MHFLDPIFPYLVLFLLVQSTVFVCLFAYYKKMSSALKKRLKNQKQTFCYDHERLTGQLKNSHKKKIKALEKKIDKSYEENEAKTRKYRKKIEKILTKNIEKTEKTDGRLKSFFKKISIRKI